MFSSLASETIVRGLCCLTSASASDYAAAPTAAAAASLDISIMSAMLLLVRPRQAAHFIKNSRMTGSATPLRVTRVLSQRLPPLSWVLLGGSADDKVARHVPKGGQGRLGDAATAQPSLRIAR